VKISEAISNDEIINRENRKIIAEKNSHIEEINRRIATSNENVEILEKRHKKLLREMLSILIEEQYELHLKAIEELKNSLKTSAKLASIFSREGITSQSKFNFDQIINGLVHGGLLENFNNIKNEISLEVEELKNEFNQQAIF
jgi:hypothetical protein